MQRRPLPTLLALAFVAGCGASQPNADSTMGHHHDHEHEHAHEHGHDPLVHRFEHAEDWAKEFDDPARDAWQKPAEVVALLAITPGMVVADVGAGTGYFEPHLARAVGATGAVLALDIEPDMIRYMRQRFEREHLANVTPKVVAGDDPGLAPASVDRVLVVDTWHHIPERKAYAAKLAAALKPGGFVAIVDFALEAQHGPPKEHRLAPERVIEELASAGLRGEIASETLPEQYVVIGRKP